MTRETLQWHHRNTEEEDYYEKLYTNKSDKLEKSEHSPRHIHQPRLNHEKNRKYDWPITSNITESVIKSLISEKSPRPHAWSIEFQKALKEQIEHQTKYW